MNWMLFVVTIPRRIILDPSTDTVLEYHKTVLPQEREKKTGYSPVPPTARTQPASNGVEAGRRLEGIFAARDIIGDNSSEKDAKGTTNGLQNDATTTVHIPDRDATTTTPVAVPLAAAVHFAALEQSQEPRSHPMLDVSEKMEEMLAVRKINATWLAGAKGKTFVVQFTVSLSRVEDVMEALMGIGIGTDYGSINVIPVEISKAPVVPEEEAKGAAKFRESMRARMTMEKAIAQAKAGAEVTFDYLMFVVCAATIAGVGLASNSVVSVVASMLVSPIMGPILEFTFGTVIADWPMVRHGFMVEGLSLLICVVVGFLIGLASAWFGYDYWNWPNNEISGRGTWQNCIVGIAVAIPSGAGVALSILGSNVPALVGVAISASLLPPAVNCGLSMAYALIGPLFEGSTVDPHYFLEIGGWSFFLTIVNIVCIYFVGLLIFKIKEVAPIPGKTDFWKNEVKIARRHNNTVNAGVATTVTSTQAQNTLTRRYTSQGGTPYTQTNQNTSSDVDYQIWQTYHGAGHHPLADPYGSEWNQFNAFRRLSSQHAPSESASHLPPVAESPSQI